ncbi:MAG TPA: tripartite tricarboxylate transporter substrate-binding protein [Variovorax sp.]|nr:tripartite tricarboxylate transporter substrate-binding protein [Variovorax sp.]
MSASSALLLVVPATSSILTVAQPADALRQARGGMNCASSGAGTGGHLTGETFAHMPGAKAIHVPYEGMAPALTDVAGGQLDFSFGVIPCALALVKADRLRTPAVTSARRLTQLPEVATVAESGVGAPAGFESSLTCGILAPRGTPMVGVRKLGAEILQVAASAVFQSRLGVEGAQPLLGDAAAYAGRTQRESSKWAAVVKASGASV